MLPELWEQRLCLLHCLNIRDKRQRQGVEIVVHRHTDVTGWPRSSLQPWIHWDCHGSSLPSQLGAVPHSLHQTPLSPPRVHLAGICGDV